MSVIQLTSQQNAPTQDLNRSSMRILHSLMHTISLLEKTTGGKNTETPPFVEEWVDETYALMKQFSTRLKGKLNHYGRQHFDPILLTAAQEAEQTANSLSGLINFKNSITHTMK